MTTPEFLRLLEDVRDRFDWKLVVDTGRESERRAAPRFHIRGTPSGGAPSSEALDPLRAVCYVRTGRVFDYGAWSDVSDALDLELSATSALVAAANDRTWSGTGEQRAPVDSLLAIRQELLEAVGLHAEAEAAE